MNTATHRLFFALWPDKKLRAEIQHRIKPFISKHPAKKVPVHNWHITLAFLGNVTEEIKQCAQAKAELVQAQAFELSLDKPGFFKRAGVVWLGSKECPEALTDLVEQLNQQLAACDYQTDFKIFLPHMTLLRKAYKGFGVEEFEPINWPVNDFVLVESITDQKGAIYQVIDRWPLH